MSQDQKLLSNAHWEGYRLCFEDDDSIDRIRRKKLSPSISASVMQCPASMAAKTLLPRIDDPFAATSLGTDAHEVILEKLYRLPSLERTQERAIELLLEMAHQKWGEDAVSKKRWLMTLEPMVRGIFEVEKPQEVVIHSTELRVETVLGGVPTLCFIDRIDLDADGNFLIRDIKTGAFKLPSERFGDAYGDQLRIYSAAMRASTGKKPLEASLIYPLSRDIRIIDISERATQKTVMQFQKNWQLMNFSADRKKFEATPSNLCGWCPIVNACPVARVKTDKAQLSASTQYAAEEIGISAQKQELMSTAAGVPSHKELLFPVTLTQSIHTSETKESPEQSRENEKTKMQEQGSLTFVRPETVPFEEMIHGVLNLNSYAATAVCGITSEAFDILTAAKQKISPSSLAAMSDVLAGLVLRAQKQVTGVASFQRGAQTRLRGLLRTMINEHPPPIGSDMETWNSWLMRTERFLVVALNAAIALHERMPEQNTAHLYFAVEGTKS